MVVTCPSCASWSTVCDGDHAPDEQTMRCLKCGNRWSVSADLRPVPQSRPRPQAGSQANNLERVTLARKGEATGGVSPDASETPETPNTSRSAKMCRAAKPSPARVDGGTGRFGLFAMAMKVIALAMLGEYEKAVALFRKTQQANVCIMGKATLLADPQSRDIFQRGLRSAGPPNLIRVMLPRSQIASSGQRAPLV